MAPESLAQDYRASVGRQIGADDVEVLCAPEHLVGAAVCTLGWDGTELPPEALLGRRVVVVADLVKKAHECRMASGWGPVTDRMSVSLWNWPQMHHLVPPVAVRLRGVLAPARHWRTGLAAVAPFTGLCATALLLPADIARNAECRRHAGRHGPSLVAAAGPADPDPGAVDLIQSGRRPSATQPNPISRWVHELVYDRLLRLASSR